MIRINAIMGDDRTAVLVTSPIPQDFPSVAQFLTWLGAEHARLLDAGELLQVTTSRSPHGGDLDPRDRWLREQIGEGACGACLTA